MRTDRRVNETPMWMGNKMVPRLGTTRTDRREWGIPYVKGKLHGAQIWYYENGNKMEDHPMVDGKNPWYGEGVP